MKTVDWLTSSVLLMQGGAPSPFDRNFGTKLGVKAVQWLSEKMVENFRQGNIIVHSQDHS